MCVVIKWGGNWEGRSAKKWFLLANSERGARAPRTLAAEKFCHSQGTRMTTHGDGDARHTAHSERTTRLESKRAQSMRGAQVHWAAATVINPAHASHSTTDGKRKKYWRVAHSRSSTVGSARSRELRVRSQ